MRDTAMDEYRAANRELWNEWASLHYSSKSYDVDAFKAGKSSLKNIEREGVGDVAGKSLLHLQCHFGKDTLSWARLGASVTGADFSPRAIELARGLSVEIGVPANFVCSDLYALPDVLDGQFDIVFTSYGAIYWLPELRSWARVINHFLKPGGLFFIAEFHPFSYVFENRDGEGRDKELRLTYPYFSSGEPLRFETQGSYAVPDADYKGVEYDWPHSMSEIVNSLLEVGLKIESLHEYPFSVDGSMFAGMERGEDGYYRLIGQHAEIPLMFSLKATKF